MSSHNQRHETPAMKPETSSNYAEPSTQITATEIGKFIDRDLTSQYTKPSSQSMGCSNCKTQTTPVWRQDDDGNILCNACGLFWKLHGKIRPVLSFNQPVTVTANIQESSSTLAAKSSQMTPPSSTGLTSVVTSQQDIQKHVDAATSIVLEGIDDIDWASKSHAYGSAAEVPSWIKALQYPDTSNRSAAISQLEDNLVHQGSRWEATPLTIPFLLKLATDPLTPNREDILELLVDLAVGDPEDWQPQSINVRQWREQSQVSGNSPINWDFLSYDAVRAGVPSIRALLLNDMTPRVQSWSAYLLAWFPEDASEEQHDTLNALWQIIDKKAHYASTVASAVLAVGLLSAGLVWLHRPAACAKSTYNLEPTKLRLIDISQDERPQVRWAASKALVDLDMPTSNAIVNLVSASKNLSPGQSWEGVVPSGKDVVGSSEESICGFAVRNADTTSSEKMDTILEAFAKVSHEAAYEVGGTVFILAFGFEKPPPHPSQPLFHDLNELQKRSIRAVAKASDEKWRDAGLDKLFRRRGFLRERVEVRQWAGIDEP